MSSQIKTNGAIWIIVYCLRGPEDSNPSVLLVFGWAYKHSLRYLRYLRYNVESLLRRNELCPNLDKVMYDAQPFKPKAGDPWITRRILSPFCSNLILNAELNLPLICWRSSSVSSWLRPLALLTKARSASLWSSSHDPGRCGRPVSGCLTKPRKASR